MIFYRYEIKEKSRSTLCDFVSTINEVVLFEFEVEKETPEGYWIKQTTQDGKIQRTCSKSRVWVAKGNAVRHLHVHQKNVRFVIYSIELKNAVRLHQYSIRLQSNV